MQDSVREKLLMMMKKHMKGSALGGVNIGGASVSQWHAFQKHAKLLGEVTDSKKRGIAFKKLDKLGKLEDYLMGNSKWSTYLKGTKETKTEDAKISKEIIKDIIKELPISIPKEVKKEIAENIMISISDKIGSTCYEGVTNLSTKLKQMKTEEDKEKRFEKYKKDLKEKEEEEVKLLKELEKLKNVPLDIQDIMRGSGRKKGTKSLEEKKKAAAYARSFIGHKKRCPKKKKAGILSMFL